MADKNKPYQKYMDEPKYKTLLKKHHFIDVTGWDLTLIEMWNNNSSRNEIARKVNKLPATVSTRMMNLRKKFGDSGTDILPFRNIAKKKSNSSQGN